MKEGVLGYTPDRRGDKARIAQCSSLFSEWNVSLEGHCDQENPRRSLSFLSKPWQFRGGMLNTSCALPKPRLIWVKRKEQWVSRGNFSRTGNGIGLAPFPIS